jgi:hypothetical protein
MLYLSKTLCSTRGLYIQYTSIHQLEKHALSGLTSPHFYACPEPMSYVVVTSMVSELSREVIIRFIDN